MARVAQVTSNSRPRKPSPARTQRTGFSNQLRQVLGEGRSDSVPGDGMAVSLVGPLGIPGRPPPAVTGDRAEWAILVRAAPHPTNCGSPSFARPPDPRARGGRGN